MLPLDAWPPVRWEITAAGDEAAAAEARSGPADESRSFATSYKLKLAGDVTEECFEGLWRKGYGTGELLGALGTAGDQTYSNVVLQLDSPGRIEFDILQCLANDIVRLALACLGSLDGSGLVNVTLVVDIELAEGVG